MMPQPKLSFEVLIVGIEPYYRCMAGEHNAPGPSGFHIRQFVYGNDFGLFSRGQMLAPGSKGAIKAAAGRFGMFAPGLGTRN